MEANLCITFETLMKMLKQRTQMRNRDEDLRSIELQSSINFADAQRYELPPWDYNTRREPPRPAKRLRTFDDGDLLAPPANILCLGPSKKRKRENDDNDDENEEEDCPAKCQKRNQGYCITENDYEELEVLIEAQDQHKASFNPVVTVMGSRPLFKCIEYMLCFMIAILSIYVRLLFSWISGFSVFPDALDTLSE